MASGSVDNPFSKIEKCEAIPEINSSFKKGFDSVLYSVSEEESSSNSGRCSEVGKKEKVQKVTESEVPAINSEEVIGKETPRREGDQFGDILNIKKINFSDLSTHRLKFFIAGCIVSAVGVSTITVFGTTVLTIPTLGILFGVEIKPFVETVQNLRDSEVLDGEVIENM
ncbi:hypothetical protein HK099_001783, partial [Clydaea vesicula]